MNYSEPVFVDLNWNILFWLLYSLAAFTSSAAAGFSRAAAGLSSAALAARLALLAVSMVARQGSLVARTGLTEVDRVDIMVDQAATMGDLDSKPPVF